MTYAPFARPALILGTLVCAACSGSNERPILTGPTPGPILTHVTVSGSGVLARPGDTSQLRAVGTYDNGSTVDVTSSMGWHSSNAKVVTITSNGVLTAVDYGKAVITYPAYTNVEPPELQARVVPPGMFVITGRVMEGGFAVPGARIEMTSPAMTHTTTSGEFDGRFMGIGGGEVTVRVEKPGYVAATLRLTVARDEEIVVDLSLGAGPVEHAGIYRLTFIASPSCSLRSDVMRRSYLARITEAHGLLTVNLEGAAYGGWGSFGFLGVLENEEAAFSITSDWFSDYSMVEQLDATTALEFDGKARGPITPGRILTSFDGTVTITTGWSSIGQCKAPDHRLEFVR